jgi:hypothetical protein
MKIKISIAAFAVATALTATAGTAQAACTYKSNGWHLVSKHCDIRPSQNWQTYNSGNYIQPVTDSSFAILWPNKIPH